MDGTSIAFSVEGGEGSDEEEDDRQRKAEVSERRGVISCEGDIVCPDSYTSC